MKKRIVEDYIVKNKDTGNIYSVKNFDSDKHESMDTDNTGKPIDRTGEEADIKSRELQDTESSTKKQSKEEQEKAENLAIQDKMRGIIKEMSTPKQSGKVLLRSLLEGVQTRPIYEIADEIRDDWKNVNYAAKPYLSAMFDIDKITDTYGADSGRSIVAYFLANATSWRGDVAKRVKLELNRMIK